MEKEEGPLATGPLDKDKTLDTKEFSSLYSSPKQAKSNFLDPNWIKISVAVERACHLSSVWFFGGAT